MHGIEEDKRLPLSHLAASSNNLSELSLQLMGHAYPESIITGEKYGMLPFHHACLNTACSLEVLFALLKLFSAAIVHRKTRSRKIKLTNQ